MASSAASASRWPPPPRRGCYCWMSQRPAWTRRGLPTACGWSAALPGHALAPEASLTRIVEQLRRALDWLQQEGPAQGIAGPVILSGWSAGGHLAALLAEAEIATLSPQQLPISSRPIAVAYGERELPELRQSVAFHARRATARAPGPLLPVVEADHFSILDHLRRPADTLLGAAQSLLRSWRDAAPLAPVAAKICVSRSRRDASERQMAEDRTEAVPRLPHPPGPSSGMSDYAEAASAFGNGPVLSCPCSAWRNARWDPRQRRNAGDQPDAGRHPDSGGGGPQLRR